MEILESDVMSLPRLVLTVAVAVNGNKNCKYAVKWCLDNLSRESATLFKILHIRPKITSIPTELGFLPISDVREEVAAAYKKEVEWKAKNMLVPYKRLCAQRKIEAEAVVLESDNVAEAIAEEILKSKFSKLVIGTSGKKLFNWKSNGHKLSSKISEIVPNFCTVYVVSKGKLSSVRASTTDVNWNTGGLSGSSVSSCSLSSNYSERNVNKNVSSHVPLPSHRGGAIATISQNHLQSGNSSSFSDEAFISFDSSITTSQSSNSTISLPERNRRNNRALTSSVELDSSASTAEEEINIDFEIEMLNIELKHLREVFHKAQDESKEASQKAGELGDHLVEEATKLQEIQTREEKTRESIRKERARRKAAEKRAKYLNECMLRESSQRKHLERNTTDVAKEKKWLERTLSSNGSKLYKEFTWQEIESATCEFSESRRIGAGANGIVYKGSFHHTLAAVKVFHPSESPSSKQFNQELEVLGRIYHPHLLLLIGACLERSCLVFEYMENGSLDDRLRRKDGTPPLPWHRRYRIAWEVASALFFLHSVKPEPIIHRDLKPANILLDGNFSSKIGDAGLSTLLPARSFSSSTLHKNTALAGTLCYIDPEYQWSGMVSTKSDVYALGIVILQLLTAMPPMGLAHIVETALQKGSLGDILDLGAGKWPMKETQELAFLGLKCAEMRQRDRPDLKVQILPFLEKLKEIGDEARGLSMRVPSSPPNHFLCPILKEVMVDPCTAFDGFTYDRRAIEEWLHRSDKSPVTNQWMPNKNLIPNLSLRSAIKNWKPPPPSL